MKHRHEWYLADDFIAETPNFIAATLIYVCSCGENRILMGRSV